MPPRYTFIGGESNTPKMLYGMPYMEFVSLDPDEQLNVWSDYLHKDDAGPCALCGMGCPDGDVCEPCKESGVSMEEIERALNARGERTDG